MADEAVTTTQPADAPADEPRGAAAYTDDQLAASFPGQDIEHVKTMLDRAAGIYKDPKANADDTATTPKTPAPSDSPAVEYPAWIPEKFRQGTVEEAMQKLAESYTTIERSRGQQQEDPASTNAGDAGDDGADDDQAPAPLSLFDLESAFIENGNKVPEEMYAQAEANGMDRETVDRYLAGQQAIANQLITKVHTMAGGQKDYDAMMHWMIGNQSEAEINAYDEAMATGNEAKITMAVRSLMAAYEAAVGTDPSLRLDPTNGKNEAPGYQSKREMIDAMKDPRYGKDPAYRAEVARRIASGNVW